MARALLIAGVWLLPAWPARAVDLQGRPDVPPQVAGVQMRLGAGALVGEGAGHVDQPPVSHGSLSLQIRVIEGWYVDLSTFGERTLSAKAPRGKTILGLEGTTGGVRGRLPVASSPALRLLPGAGAGGARVFVQGEGVSFGGAAAYLSMGLERELYGEEHNAGYVGLEGIYQQYLVGTGAPFRGGGFTVRVTFSYYMGGSYLSECW